LGVQRFEAINVLPDDTDRFGTMGLQANDPNFENKRKARIGCLLSHQEIITKSYTCGLDRILILEDDVQFVSDFAEQYKAMKSQIPSDWSLLYFGGNEMGMQEKVSENILKINHMLMTHAVGIHHTAYAPLLSLLQSSDTPVDVVYAMLQKTHPCYAFYPYLAWQRAGWSDIEMRFRIYDLENRSTSLNQVLKCKVHE
jgi:GR25 family glycosyltransferase involved in LPS biosynthesis